MTPERWDKVVSIFHAATDKRPEERGALLDEACQGDDDLRAQVEALLREEGASGTFLFRLPFGESGPEPPNPAASVGQIAHYTLIEKLGEGGMGSVFKAWDHKLDRLVALKFLSPRLYADSEMKSRFLQEAKTTSALDHPNICTVYGLEELEEGRTFIVMAFYAGETVRQKIERGPLPPGEAMGLAAQVGNGLAKAHSAGVVHRDLKPANVILTPDGLAKILDFGIAKLGEGPGITRPGTTVGTVAYMSPEQALGRQVDQRTDIWSLGVLLYEMLTARQPFTGENDLAILYAIVHEDPQPVNVTQSPWPPGLDSVLWKALAKDVGQRYSNVTEMTDDLDRVIRGLQPERTPRAELRGKPSSIAVLPFANLSRDPEYEYFSDGLTEELINTLSRVEGFRVVSRTSVFQFKGAAADIRELGRKLNVGSVLEGGVRATGSRVRITAQLVNVADGYQLWSRRYDRDLNDIFAVQDEIAQNIATKLQGRLTEGERKPLVKQMTADPEAYQLYLKGRYHCNHRTQTGLERGIELLRKAFDRDSSFAQAQVGLAEAWLLRGFWGLAPPGEAWPHSMAAAQKALELDDRLAEAHAARASILAVRDWDWTGAKREFERAIELSPNEPWVLSWYSSLYLTPTGKLEEAFETFRRCLEFDPLSPSHNASVSWIYTYTGRLEEAVRQAREAIELAPSFLENYWALAAACLQRGDIDEALHALQTAYGISRENSLTLALLVRAMKAAGRDAEAQRSLGRMQSLSRSHYVSPAHLAAAHIALGEADDAFQRLDQACETREVMLVYLKVAPTFAPIRSDPRYEQLLRRIGLDQPAVI